MFVCRDLALCDDKPSLIASDLQVCVGCVGGHCHPYRVVETEPPAIERGRPWSLGRRDIGKIVKWGQLRFWSCIIWTDRTSSQSDADHQTAHGHLGDHSINMGHVRLLLPSLRMKV